MEKAFLTLSFVTIGSALFFPFFNLQNGRQSMMNVCIYSVDPSQYMPKCFMCPSTAYTNVLQTCVEAATIPSNVSYVQARCLEQNCAIRRGRRSVATEGRDSSPSSEGSSPSGNLIPKLLHPLGSSEGASLSNYDSDDGRNGGLSIVGEEETVAMDEEDLDEDGEEDADIGELV